MELLRIRWRRRLLIAIGGLAALTLGFALQDTKSSRTGVAWTRVLLDTPRSQLIETDPPGADTLWWRASLLAHLIRTEPIKQEIARQLGIPLGQLAVNDPALDAAEVPASLPKSAAEVATINAASYVLTVSLADESLPIISVKAEARDRRRAALLATAAADVLKAEAPPPKQAAGGTSARLESGVVVQADAPRVQQFLVVEVAPVRAKAVVKNKGPIKAVALSILLFGLWCAFVAISALFVRLARARVRMQPA